MRIHVVVEQVGSNHHFDIECDRVPGHGEELAGVGVSYLVVSVLTFIKDGKGTPTVVVHRKDIGSNEKSLLSELHSNIK